MSENKRIDDTQEAKNALRQRAEHQLSQRAPAAAPDTAEGKQLLLHELQVHQIELEMQNDELRRIQEQLEASRSRYRDLYDLAPVGYVTLGADNLVLEANLTAAELLGLDRAQLVGRPITDWILPADQDIYYHHHRRLMRQDTPQTCELRMVRPGADPLWMRVNARFATCDEGHSAACRTTLNDITARKQAELALIASEARYRSLVEQAADGIFVVDSTGRFQSVNPALCTMLGYSAKELRSLSIQSLVAPDDMSASPLRLDELRAGQSILAELHLCRKDGSLLPAEVSARMLPDGQFQGVLRSIAERLAAEQLRLDLERRLLQSQKLESLGTLAGGIAHDFNNLLAAIIGNLDLALTDLPGDAPSRPLNEEALAAARRAADLTRQMLAFSGRGQFRSERMNLGQLLVENAAMLRAAIPRSVAFDVQTAKDLPSIVGDPGQMQQVVMNLITNAAEAVGAVPGTVTLSTGTMDCDTAYLDASRLADTPKPGRYVWLQVGDTGCGMSEDTQHRLFDPFFTTKATGRGLGMSAVLGIVRGHHGAILVDSLLGHGTTIRVLFPVAAAATASRGSEGERPAELRSAQLSGTVLVVDDEPMILGLGRAMLERFGLDVLCAADGEEALEVYGQHGETITCVLLDMTMPHMAGPATFEALRVLNPQLPIILSSGYAANPQTQRLLDMGRAGFVQKPYGTAALRAEIERVCLCP